MAKFSPLTATLCKRANTIDHSSLYQQFKKKRQAGETNLWHLWEPYPVQQKLLDCNADLVGFGGSAGGSKSAGLLMTAYLKHRKSLLLRKTFPNLKELLSRSREMFNGSGGKYNGLLKTWTFPDGRQIELGTVPTLMAVDNHKGREKSALLIDEVTELPGGWESLQYLMGWVRSPDPNQKCQTVVTFNPPNRPEQAWIKECFAPWINPNYDGEPALSGEIRYFATIDGENVELENGHPFEYEGELIEPQSRTFIRATLDDNIELSKTDYRRQLKSLPTVLARQLLYGDMSIEDDDDPWQVIPSEWVEQAFLRWDKQKTPPEPLSDLGVDVARGGKDKTVIAPLFGNWFAPFKKYPGPTTPNGPMVAAQIMIALEEYRVLYEQSLSLEDRELRYIKDAIEHGTFNTPLSGGLDIDPIVEPKVKIDVLGPGSSVYDAAEGLCNAIAVGSGNKSEEYDAAENLAFYNLRAEMIWKFREALDPINGDMIALPRDVRLKTDLCSYRWEVRAPSDRQRKHYKKRRNRKYPKNKLQGQIKITDKKEAKKLIHHSPDDGDACIYAYWKASQRKPITPGSTATIIPRNKSTKKDNFGR